MFAKKLKGKSKHPEEISAIDKENVSTIEVLHTDFGIQAAKQ